ncbi:MAG: hypothetical protein HQ583_08600 [Candidatus Abyssubacteria bacterium]|nr:hypothetical protein [Candidatus Abyssubacteria bacterium]
MGTNAWGCCGAEEKDRAARSESSAEKIEKVRTQKTDPGCWHWCTGGGGKDRQSGIPFGFLLIVLGAFWLAGEVGWLSEATVWPLVLVTVGLWVTVLSRVRFNRKN